MRQSARSLLLLAVSLGAVACEGRDIAVFEVPAAGGMGGGGSGGGPGPGGAGTVGSAATQIETTAGAAGSMTAPAAGTDSGGSPAALPQGGAGGVGSGMDLGGMGGGGMTGSAGTPPMPCASDADCMGWRCEKKGCDALSGFCEPPPIFCPPDPAPVCGCDGVTYWNDCIRRESGAQVAALEECRITACACEIGSDCKVANASCSHLVAPGEMCGHSKGACWVLPAQCSPSGDSHMWQECRPPDQPPGPCVDTCSAIRAQKSFAPHRAGTACN
ncbi:MAG TPA: hypothetical protein VNG33_00345 [Polyangiaceae bacterium]|nr:hypothetical protein [Polyangiaceae bacterium]